MIPAKDRSRHHYISELLTNAGIRLSGDQEGTLMVPCPPFRKRCVSKQLEAKKGNCMSYVLVRHKVANYAKWKRVVRAAAAWRKASGELSFQVFRSSSAPNDLTVVCRWASGEKARKFTASAELRKRMKEAGVISKPEVFFFKQTEDLSVG